MPVSQYPRSRSPSVKRARSISVKDDPVASMAIKMHRMQLERPNSPEFNVKCESCTYESVCDDHPHGQPFNLWIKEESKYSISRPSSSFGSRRGSFSYSEAGSEVKLEPPSRSPSVGFPHIPSRPSSRCSTNSSFGPDLDPDECHRGQWVEILPNLTNLGFKNITVIRIIISGDVSLDSTACLRLPNCSALTLRTNHPTDLAQFDLPVLTFLGITACGHTLRDLSHEVEKLVAAPTIRGLKPKCILASLPIDGHAWICLLEAIGSKAERIKIVPGLLSAMTPEFPTALMAMNPSSGARKPSILPHAKHIMVKLSGCTDYTPALLETAQTQLRLAGARRKEVDKEANLVIGLRIKRHTLTV